MFFLLRELNLEVIWLVVYRSNSLLA